MDYSQALDELGELLEAESGGEYTLEDSYSGSPAAHREFSQAIALLVAGDQPLAHRHMRAGLAILRLEEQGDVFLEFGQEGKKGKGGKAK